jgi:hypothetical protein
MRCSASTKACCIGHKMPGNFFLTAFRRSLQRAPTSAELAQVTEFIESSISGNASAEEVRDVWARFIQTLWATPEFRFLD